MMSQPVLKSKVFNKTHCHRIVDAMRLSAYISDLNNDLNSIGTEFVLTAHIGERMSDRKLDPHLFMSTTIDLLKKHVLLIYYYLITRKCIRVKHGDFVYVMSLGPVSGKMIVKTVYPYRENRGLDLDTEHIKLP